MNSTPDLELAKKSCAKAHEIIKSKRNAALTLLAFFGFSLTMTVVTFALGSLFGYYLAQLQLVPQNGVETVIVQGGYIETDNPIKHKMPQKLAQQLEQKIEENQTTISTTTTTTTTTDEDLIKFSISFDTDINEEDAKSEINQMAEIMPIWNEIFDTLGKPETDDDDYVELPISTTTTDPEVLSKTETESANIDPKDEDEDDEMASWDPDEVVQENFEEDPKISSTTQSPGELTQTFGNDFSQMNREEKDPVEYVHDKEPIVPFTQEYFQNIANQIEKLIKFKTERAEFVNRFNEFWISFFQCPYYLSRRCLIQPQLLEELVLEFKKIESDYGHIFGSLNQTEIDNLKTRLNAAIWQFHRTPMELCANEDSACKQCVQQKANCFYSFEGVCTTQSEWDIIKHNPESLVGTDEQEKCKEDTPVLFFVKNSMRFY